MCVPQPHCPLFAPPNPISGLEELGLESGSPGRGPGGDSSSVSSLGRESSAPGSTKVGVGGGRGLEVGVACNWGWYCIFSHSSPPPPSPLLQSGSGSPGGGSGGGVPAGGGLSPAEVAELFQRLAQSQQERWLLEEKVLGAMGRGWEGAREAEGIQGREWRALGGEWGREGGEVGGGRWEGGGGTCRGKDGGGRTGVGIRKGCGVILGWVWGAVGAVRGGWEGIQAMKWECLLLGGDWGHTGWGIGEQKGIGGTGMEVGQTAGSGRGTRGTVRELRGGIGGHGGAVRHPDPSQVRHLEVSSASMAEDLCRKSAIIESFVRDSRLGEPHPRSPPMPPPWGRAPHPSHSPPQKLQDPP